MGRAIPVIEMKIMFGMMQKSLLMQMEMVSGMMQHQF